MRDLKDRSLGQYRILNQIGVGGMAHVYLGYQQRLDRYVAIKAIPSHSSDRHLAARFEQEAKLIARLSHQNILQVAHVRLRHPASIPPRRG